ncbi:MAG: hypothetical protein LBH25_01615 [Fibromonadaceae bacterium]|jgi:hypothetical protein|nr:hypothetical protein [Fibromonadaceae bacterium]
MPKKQFKILAIICIPILVFFCLNYKSNSQDDLSEMKMPYVALMALRTQIIITDDKDYLENLERKSGMSRKQIKALFKYLSKNSMKEDVRINASNEISNSLKEFQNLPNDKKINFFILNILAPYLTIVVNNFAVNNADKEEIQSMFAELFNIPQNKMNPLLELTEGTYRYNSGGTSNLSYKYELNDYLRKEGFYLDYDLKRAYANIFKIERMICIDEEWKLGEKISIFVLKRIYPNILKPLLGYAPAWHSDVVVIKDFFYDVAKDYKNESKEKMPKNPYKDHSYQKLWNSLGLNINLERANSIRYELAHKDLNGNSLLQIEKNLIIQTAVHEAKHRIDEIEMPSMRLNLDLEISAYLTGAIVGVYPFLGLRKIIEWTEAYYRSTGYVKLKYLLAELWTLADKSLKQDYTENLLKAELLKIYENYSTIQENESFIDLKEFEQRMLPAILY